MCGITGLFYKENKNGFEIFEALSSIQHRGQDGAGIGCVNHMDTIIIKNRGLIHDIFTNELLQELNGNMYVGHTRYKTNSIKDGFQPFHLKNEKLTMMFCHNGNIINTDEIELYLKTNYNIINDTEVSDSYLLFQFIFYYLDNVTEDIISAHHINEVAEELHKRIKGSYSIVMTINDSCMICMKDKYGIRPLLYGYDNDGNILISSESCSEHMLNYTIATDVNPGETLIFNKNINHISYPYNGALLAPCLFEYIYFSRIESVLYNISVYNIRYALGELLGETLKNDVKKKKNLNIDFIVPTPETSRIYAYGMSSYLDIPIQECVVKNRYINRTFIIEDKNKISKNIKRKFSVIKEVVKGKNIILIDDSVVRGNTSKQIITLLRKSGVNSITFCSAAPKIYKPNKYGIYIEKKEELITYKYNSNESIANAIGADDIYYNSLENVVNLVRSMNLNVKNMEVSMFINNDS